MTRTQRIIAAAIAAGHGNDDVNALPFRCAGHIQEETCPYHPVAAMAAFLDHFWEDSLEGFEHSYLGEWDSPEHWAEEYADSIGAVDGGARWPLNHVNWTAAAGEMRAAGIVFEDSSYGVYVFQDW